MTQTATRQSLLGRKIELTRRLNSVQADLQKRHSADWSEQAQERENDEVLEEIARRTAEELQQIERGLKRLDNADYGLCSVCGEAIAAERLAVLPEAHTCIKCAESE